jgi:cation diffusion facilitator family transporter
MAESTRAIYAAMAANLAIAVTKFAVAGITGSSAMLSEGVHSLVDTGDSVLLLVGLRRSRLPPSPQHPFGHGKEMYFWSLIVAVLIFGLGGGVSLYEGVVHLRDPHPIDDPFWNYVVLGCAAVFEGISLAIGLRQFRRERGGRPFWEAMRTSKDPATYTVVAEDAAALAGLGIAGAGVFLSVRLQMPAMDGIASLLIGLLLAGVAVLLIRESRGLLVGEGIRAETARRIRELALAQEDVRVAGPILSMYVGPADALVTFELTFAPRVASASVAATIAQLERQIRSEFPTLRRIYIEPVVATGTAR